MSKKCQTINGLCTKVLNYNEMKTTLKALVKNGIYISEGLQDYFNGDETTNFSRLYVHSTNPILIYGGFQNADLIPNTNSNFVNSKMFLHIICPNSKTFTIYGKKIFLDKRKTF